MGERGGEGRRGMFGVVSVRRRSPRSRHGVECPPSPHILRWRVVKGEGSEGRDLSWIVSF